MQKPVFVPGVCLRCLCNEGASTTAHYPKCGSELTEEALIETERMIHSLQVNPLSIRRMAPELVAAITGQTRRNSPSSTPKLT